MTTLDAYLAAGRAFAAADAAFVEATRRAVACNGTPRSTAAWRAKDRASAALAKAQHALCRATLAWAASEGGSQC